MIALCLVRLIETHSGTPKDHPETALLRRTPACARFLPTSCISAVTRSNRNLRLVLNKPNTTSNGLSRPGQRRANRAFRCCLVWALAPPRSTCGAFWSGKEFKGIAQRVWRTRILRRSSSFFDRAVYHTMKAMNNDQAKGRLIRARPGTFHCELR